MCVPVYLATGVCIFDSTLNKSIYNGRKFNVWSTNKYSNELHTAVSVAFRVPSSGKSKK